LSEEFDYVLYGHHPHVVQAFEKFNKSYLFYSLGNFCFDDVYSGASEEPLVKMIEANKLGLVPMLTIENSIVVHVEHIWTYLGPDKMMVIDQDSSDIIKAVKNIDLADLDKIESEREVLLTNWLASRKYRRDLSWYLKRLRFRYVKLLLSSKRNRNMYDKHYINKLEERNIF